MRTLLVAALLVAPLAAGCITDRIRDLAPPEPTETVLPWGLSGCTFVIAVVPVPAARLAERIPPGFRVLAPAEIGLPADPRGDGNVGIEAWRCAEGVGLNASEPLHDTPYGAVFTFVEPPEELRVNGSRYHFVKWDVLVPDAGRRALLQAHGVPALEGNVTFARFQPLPGGRAAFDAELALNGTYTLRGTSAQADATEPFSFVEYTQTPHGLARWSTNATFETLGSGTGIVAASGGPFRELAGERPQAYVLVGTGGAFANGTLTLPPRPLD